MMVSSRASSSGLPNDMPGEGGPVDLAVDHGTGKGFLDGGSRLAGVKRVHCNVGVMNGHAGFREKPTRR